MSAPMTRFRRRQDRSGVALLFGIGVIMLLTVMVTDLSFGSRVRYLQGVHQRDENQAYWLANTGVSIYRLVLMANKQLAKNQMLSQGAEMFGINLADALWQMVPVINTGLLRLLFASDGDVEEEDVADYQQNGQVSDEIRKEASEEMSKFGKKSFLEFDGDFVAEVRGEDCRFNINMFSTRTAETVLQDDALAQMLYGMLSGEENEAFLRDRNLDRWELVGNLADWVDADNMVASGRGGYEDDFYNRLDSPYLSKNAAFDTLEEIRMVEGWQDEVYDRFAENLTIFGSKKININCAETDVVRAMLKAYVTPTPTDATVDQIMELIAEYRALGTFGTGQSFCTWLSQSAGVTLSSTSFCSQLSKDTNVFTITSTGQVGESTVTITAVVDYNSSSEGKLIYWRVE